MTRHIPLERFEIDEKREWVYLDEQGNYCSGKLNQEAATSKEVKQINYPYKKRGEWMQIWKSLGGTVDSIPENEVDAHKVLPASKFWTLVQKEYQRRPEENKKARDFIALYRQIQRRCYSTTTNDLEEALDKHLKTKGENH